MKLNNIHVSNFKSFKDLDFDIRRINIVLGPNNSGKSNILKLLLLLKQTYSSSLNAPLILNGNIYNFGSFINITNNYNGKNIEIRLNFNVKRTDLRIKRKITPRIKGNLNMISEYYYDEKIKKIRFKKFEIENIEQKNVILKYTSDFSPIINNKTSDEYIKEIEKSINKIIDILDEIPQFGLKVDTKESIRWLVNFPLKLEKIFSPSDFSTVFEYYKKFLLKLRRKKIFINLVKDVIIPRIEINYRFRGEIEYNLGEFFLDLNRFLSTPEIRKIIICNNFDKLKEDLSEINNLIEGLINIDNLFFELSRLLRDIERIIRTFFENTFYIGPLRTIPERYYTVIGEYSRDVGIKGEYSHLLLKSSLENKAYKHILEKLNYWLNKFEMAKDFKIKDYEEISELISIIFNEYFSGLNVNITDMGIGTSQVLPIILEGFLINRKSVLMVEQPEIHLHPKAQSDLGDLFIEIANEEKNLIIETHSAYLIQRIQRRIAEGSISHKDVMFYYVTMTKDGSLIRKLEIDEDGYIKNVPDGFFDEDYREAYEHLSINLKKKK